MQDSKRFRFPAVLTAAMSTVALIFLLNGLLCYMALGQIERCATLSRVARARACALPLSTRGLEQLSNPFRESSNSAHTPGGWRRRLRGTTQAHRLLLEDGRLAAHGGCRGVRASLAARPLRLRWHTVACTRAPWPRSTCW